MYIHIDACYLFIYLFIRQDPTPATARSARINAMKRNKKERQVRSAKKRDQDIEGETTHPMFGIGTHKK